VGIKKRVKDKANSFNGQKSGLPVEEITIKDGVQVKNMVLKEGSLEKINGATIYAEILPDESGGITSLSRFKNLTVAQRGYSLACENSEDSQTFTTLTTALTSNNRCLTSQWRDRIYFVNKVDAKFLLNRTSGSLSSSRVFGDLSVDPPHFFQMQRLMDLLLVLILIHFRTDQQFQ